MDQSESIARRAFDAVAAAEKASNLEELNRVVRPVFESLGFQVYAGVDAVDAAGKRDVHVLFGKTHDPWEARYNEAGHAANDAMIREMLSSTDAMFWSDVQHRRIVAPAELQIMNEARQFGLSNGFMTPLHNIDGSISAVLLMGESVDTADPDLRAAAHLLSVYYGGIGRKLRRETLHPAKMRPKLTKRQTECLLWVRAGKSSSDIGDILGISAAMVNEHVAAACQRLGVRTRIQAVAEAALHGLIEL